MWYFLGGILGLVAGIIALIYLPNYLGHAGRLILAFGCIFVGLFGLVWLQRVKQKKGVKA